MHSRYRAAIAATAVAALLGVAIATPGTTAPLDDQAAMHAACTARLADPQPLTPAQQDWLQTCRDVFAPPAPTPSASASPSASPTPLPSPSPSVSPTPSPSATPSPAPTIPPPSVCPAWPAFPDEHCTGFIHTGVTEASLTTCPTRLTVANAVYDRCRFPSGVIIAADNIRITRSLVIGVVNSVNGNNQMRGLSLTDVEIRGVAGGTDRLAAIGTENYSCLRCHVHGGYRGFALGSNVRIIDSYSHGFRTQPEAHQTAASSHVGAGVVIDHSRLRCESNDYACSGGVNWYAEYGNISDILVQRSHISTDAGPCMGFYHANSGGNKRFLILNTRILNNVLANNCEYGALANWPAGGGNVWVGNTFPDGRPINP